MMEELLNKLIEKGWKPFGKEKTLHIKIYDCDLNVYFDGGFMNEDKKSFRELVSKESGLWQFCCRNKLVGGKPEWIKTCGGVVREEKQPSNSHYRLIESALCDEEDLEKFLIDNINVEGQ